MKRIKFITLCMIVCLMLTGCFTTTGSSTKQTNTGNSITSYSYTSLVDNKKLRYPLTDNQFRYTLYDECAVITEHLVSEEIVYIPATLEGVPVVGFETNVFAGDLLLKKIVIGKNILRIPAGAFKGCSNLVVVEMSDTVKEIMKEAFLSCERLRSIEIPPYVAKITASSFKGCERLKTVVIAPAADKKTGRKLESGCFSDCPNLEAIWLPNDIKEIDKNAFSGTTSGFTIYAGEHSVAAQYAASHLMQYVLTPEKDFDATVARYVPVTREDDAKTIGDTVREGKTTLTLDDVKFYKKLGELEAPDGQTIMLIIFTVENKSSAKISFSPLSAEVKTFRAASMALDSGYFKRIHIIPSSLTGYDEGASEILAHSTKQMCIAVIVNENYNHVNIQFAGFDEVFKIQSIV